MNDYEYFDIGLKSEILPGLVMGGTQEYNINPLKLPSLNPPIYNLVVTHYEQAEKYHPKTKELRLCYPDSTIEFVNKKKLFKIVDEAHQAWSNGGNVFVRCHAGLNRSGLTVALILMREDYEPSDAINLIRQKRSHHALHNHHYVAFLESMKD